MHEFYHQGTDRPQIHQFTQKRQIIGRNWHLRTLSIYLSVLPILNIEQNFSVFSCILKAFNFFFKFCLFVSCKARLARNLSFKMELLETLLKVLHFPRNTFTIFPQKLNIYFVKHFPFFPTSFVKFIKKVLSLVFFHIMCLFLLRYNL